MPPPFTASRQPQSLDTHLRQTRLLPWRCPVTKPRGSGGLGNTVIVFAGIFLLLALLGLVSYYLWDFLKSLPAAGYECAAYALTGTFLFAGSWPSCRIWILDIQPLWFVVPAAFAFAGCIYLTYWLHWLRKRGQVGGRGKVDTTDTVHTGPFPVKFPQVLFGLCTVVWGFFAIVYHHAFADASIPKFLAFIAVMALQSFMGFSIITRPGCILLGWETEKGPRSTISALIILAAYVVIMLNGNAVPADVKLFEPGCLFMGAFIDDLDCL